MQNKDELKRMNKEERRKQIIHAALTVFIDKGYNGATTLEIAKTAGVSEVTLYRYFESKQEMFLAGIEPILFNTLEASINGSCELGAAEKLEHVLYERIKFISSNYKIVKLILTEASFLSELGSDNFMNRIIEALKTMLSQIGILIGDEDYALRLLMGSILSFLYMPENDEEKIKKYVNKIMTVILKETNK